MRETPITSREQWLSLRRRFEEKFLKDGEHGCWLWAKSKCSSGYGTFHLFGKTEQAHRVSWRIYFGEIPNGAHVLHKCDARGCVNPDHLFLGDNEANVADRVSKGRSARIIGTEQASSSTTDEDAVGIWNAVGPYREIAKRFGVNVAVVQNIKSGKAWRHVTGGIPNKNGTPKGSRVHGSKLNPGQVLAIRDDPRPQAEIAREHGVCQMTVSLVKRKVVWSHV